MQEAWQPGSSLGEARGSGLVRAREETDAEAEPHVPRRRIEAGGARGANDAAEDVRSQREFVLHMVGSVSHTRSRLKVKEYGRTTYRQI